MVVGPEAQLYEGHEGGSVSRPSFVLAVLLPQLLLWICTAASGCNDVMGGPPPQAAAVGYRADLNGQKFLWISEDILTGCNNAAAAADCTEASSAITPDCSGCIT